MSARDIRPPFVLAASVLAAVALAACTPQAQIEGSPTPSASITSTPTPEPTPAGGRVAFDGDCSTVVETSELSAAMGEEMTFWEPAWVDGAEDGLGGVRCGWVSDEYLSGFATIWAYPLSVLDPAYVGGEASNSCSAHESSCVVSGVFGDTWVGVQAYSSRAQEQIERLSPVLAAIGARAAESKAPVPGPRENWWMPVATCEQVASSLTDAGMPARATDDRPAGGPLFVGGPRDRGCTMDVSVQGEQRVAILYLSAGAGSGVASVLSLDPSQRVEFEGQTFANAGEQYPLDGNPGLLLGTDGVNLVSMLRGDADGQPALDAPILAAVLAAL